VSKQRQILLLSALAVVAIGVGALVMIASTARPPDTAPEVVLEPAAAVDRALARSRDAATFGPLLETLLARRIPGDAGLEHPLLDAMAGRMEATDRFVAALTRRLDDRRREVRITALGGLAALGPGAVSATPAVLAVVRGDTDREVVRVALVTLASIATGSAEAADEVARALLAPAAGFEIGPEPSDVAHVIARLVKFFARFWDFATLERLYRSIDATADTGTLSAVLSDLYVLVDTDAARPTAARFAALLGHPNADVRASAAELIRTLVPRPGADDVDAVLRYLAHDDDRVRALIHRLLTEWADLLTPSGRRRAAAYLCDRLEGGGDDFPDVCATLAELELDRAESERVASHLCDRLERGDGDPVVARAALRKLAPAPADVERVARVVTRSAGSKRVASFAILADAVEALSRRGDGADVVRRLHPFFVARRDDEHAVVRSHALAVLVTVYRDTDSTADRLIARIERESGDARRRAVRLLGQLDAERLGHRAEAATTALLAAMDDANENGATRAAAVRVLRNFPDATETVVPRLAAILADELADSPVRDAAFVSLALLGEAAAGALPTLAALEDADPDIKRDRVLVALGRIGPAAASELPRILTELESQTEALQTWTLSRATVSSLDAIARIGRASPEVTEALLQPFDDDDFAPEGPSDRTSRIRALSRLEPLGPDIGPRLVALLAEDTAPWGDWELCEELANALAELGPCADRRAARTLVATLDDASRTEPHARAAAARALGALTVEPQLRVESLLRAARHGSSAALRAAAARALVVAGPAVEPYVGEALRLLDDRDAFVREAAVELLGELRVRPDIACPRVAAMLSDAHPVVRRRAARALGAFGAAAASQVAHLAARLADDDARVRWEAARSLGRIGPAAHDALRAAQGDDDARVRETVDDALEAITGGET